MSLSSSSSGTMKSVDESLEQHGVHLEDDNQIEWNEDAKDHPRRWIPWAKYYTTIVISWVELYMTGISSAGVGAL